MIGIIGAIGIEIEAIRDRMEHKMTKREEPTMKLTKRLIALLLAALLLLCAAIPAFAYQPGEQVDLCAGEGCDTFTYTYAGTITTGETTLDAVTVVFADGSEAVRPTYEDAMHTIAFDVASPEGLRFTPRFRYLLDGRTPKLYVQFGDCDANTCGRSYSPVYGEQTNTSICPKNNYFGWDCAIHKYGLSTNFSVWRYNARHTVSTADILRDLRQLIVGTVRYKLWSL